MQVVSLEIARLDADFNENIEVNCALSLYLVQMKNFCFFLWFLTI